MNLQEFDAEIQDLKIITTVLHRDNRGSFQEVINPDMHLDWFVQENNIVSNYGVLRGLHIQKGLQYKLVRCSHGKVLDIVVDCRKDSSTVGKYKVIELNNINVAVLVPPGCAHGIMSLTPDSVVEYKSSTRYGAYTEYSLRWDDPMIKIDLLQSRFFRPQVSDKDRSGMTFNQLMELL